MKKHFFILSCYLLTTLFLNAQDQTINGATFKQDGKVGIGTTAPSAELEVAGTADNASVVLSNENLIGFKRADGYVVYGIGHTAGEFCYW